MDGVSLCFVVILGTKKKGDFLGGFPIGVRWDRGASNYPLICEFLWPHFWGQSSLLGGGFIQIVLQMCTQKTGGNMFQFDLLILFKL